MSAAETEAPTPVAFSVPVPEADHTNDVIVFNLDDDPGTPLTATRAKRATIKALMNNAYALVDTDDEDATAAAAYEQILIQVLDDDSLAYLNKRFTDDDDDLDLNIIRPIVDQLIGAWYGGPTGSPRGSAPSRKPSGGRSTGRVPSKGSTRST